MSFLQKRCNVTLLIMIIYAYQFFLDVILYSNIFSIIKNHRLATGVFISDIPRASSSVELFFRGGSDQGPGLATSLGAGSQPHFSNRGCSAVSVAHESTRAGPPRNQKFKPLLEIIIHIFSLLTTFSLLFNHKKRKLIIDEIIADKMKYGRNSKNEKVTKQF